MPAGRPADKMIKCLMEPLWLIRLVLENIRSGKYSFHSGSVSHSIRVVYNVAS